VIASGVPVTIPGYEDSAAVIEGISGDVGLEDDTTTKRWMTMSAKRPIGRPLVNGYLFAPGDKVQARNDPGESFERVCTVIKTAKTTAHPVHPA